MGIAGRSGVLFGVGDGVASGVETGGVVDLFTRLPDCAKAVSTQKTINAVINTVRVRNENTCRIERFRFENYFFRILALSSLT